MPQIVIAEIQLKDGMFGAEEEQRNTIDRGINAIMYHVELYQ